eukprot:TRINITY_DN2038_c0_g1_i1.p1 TRINITY_DN2038_c0_g1~~TRINITY_DN2038_c0_g1_i1.p1  ORF type:complete len:203 (-),score=83.03 TRINITY_DN2038_c0_g1_i1:40-648(-)
MGRDAFAKKRRGQEKKSHFVKKRRPATIEFNPDDRINFITGFRKRKNERRKVAQHHIAEMEVRERKEAKATKREEEKAKIQQNKLEAKERRKIVNTDRGSFLEIEMGEEDEDEDDDEEGGEALENGLDDADSSVVAGEDADADADQDQPEDLSLGGLHNDDVSLFAGQDLANTPAIKLKTKKKTFKTGKGLSVTVTTKPLIL